MSAHDPYLVLGVRPDAPDEQIRRAYRRLARETHPDHAQDDAGAEERFKEISAAYSEITRRRQVPRTPEIWEERADPVPGEDREVAVDIDLDALVTGGGGEVVVRRLVTCEACAGTGDAEARLPLVCGACDGVGIMRRGARMGETCPHCEGRGRMIRESCGECDGLGRTERTDRVRFRIPPGAVDGDRLRLKGMGDEGVMGGRDGDLFVELVIEAGPGVMIDGVDLVTTCEIDLLDLILGTTLAVTVGEKTVRVRVPAGTTPDTDVRRRGLGLPGADGTRGDLIITLRTTATPEMPEEARRLLRRARDLIRAQGRADGADSGP